METHRRIAPPRPEPTPTARRRQAQITEGRTGQAHVDRGTARVFVRFSDFLSQIIDDGVTGLEKRSLFLRPLLHENLRIDDLRIEREEAAVS
jgi:hypothetical protein